MKLALPAVAFLATSLLSTTAFAADLADVKAVYLLPMSFGMDQYLAIRLTTGSKLQVVTDPQKADAIFTDRIGPGLEKSFDDLYGVVKTKSDDKSDASKGDFGKSTMQPMSKGRGAVFLVDRKTRDVLWSTFEMPKSSAASDVKHAADKVADKLEKQIKGK